MNITVMSLLFICVKETEGNENSIIVCSPDDIKLNYFGNILTYLETEYKVIEFYVSTCLNMFLQGGALEIVYGKEKFLSFDIAWPRCVLRSLVYKRVKQDIVIAIVELAKQYSLELS